MDDRRSPLPVVGGHSAVSSGAPDQLAREGWLLRFVVDRPRAEEARDLYRQLGYAVRLEAAAPFSPHGSDCAGCHEGTGIETLAVYTRVDAPPREGSAPDANRREG